MIVINLFAGPGAGKSTIAAGVFAIMKATNFRVELVTEFAKELTWKNAKADLDDAFFVGATQQHRQAILEGQVDFCVTDSPILTSCLYAYGKYNAPWLHRAMINAFQSYDNRNFIIQRRKPYQQYGRNQSEAEAKQKDIQTQQLLATIGEKAVQIRGDRFAARDIVDHIVNEFGSPGYVQSK